MLIGGSPGNAVAPRRRRSEGRPDAERDATQLKHTAACPFGKLFLGMSLFFIIFAPLIMGCKIINKKQ